MFLFIILLIPVHEGADTALNRGRRPIPRKRLQKIGAGKCNANVAGLHRQHVFLRLPAERLFDRGDEIEEIDGLTAADIDDTVGSDWAQGIDPVGETRVLARGDERNEADHRLDQVVDIGEVVGSSRVDLQACKLEYSIVSPK